MAGKPKTIVKAPVPKECIICTHETINGRLYCERCRSHVQSRKMDKLKRRAALQLAYCKDLDAFLCFYSRLPLAMDDSSGPFWIQFDHRIPIKSSDFVASCSVFNQMKGDLADDEFRLAMILLRNRRKGIPFDKGTIEFKYWSREPEPLGAAPIEDIPLGESPTKNCVVCGRKSHPRSVYCPRCRNYMRAGKENLPRRAALQASYDRKRRKFICHYSGVELNDSDINDPWYVSFDRAIPRKKGDLAVSALWISMMKADLGRDEFYPVVDELAGCFETCKTFDKAVCGFKYWQERAGAERLFREKPLPMRKNQAARRQTSSSLHGRIGASMIRGRL